MAICALFVGELDGSEGERRKARSFAVGFEEIVRNESGKWRPNRAWYMVA